jgi:uncharacterized repeat protein (TIGR02543 family)
MKVAQSLRWRYVVGVVLLLLSVVTASRLMVRAQSGEVIAAVVPSNETPGVGQQIEVEIRVDMSGMEEPDHQLGSYTFTLDWDPDVLEYVTDSGALEGFTGEVDITDVATGQVTFDGANDSGATGTFVILRITFDVIGAGTADLDLTCSSIASAGTLEDLLSHLVTLNGEVVASKYTLTVVVDPEEGGTVVVDPDKAAYHHDDLVTLTAIPEPGWFFGGWVFEDANGQTTGILLDILGSMISDVTVTATFLPIPENHNVLAVWVEPFGMGTTNPAAGFSAHPADTDVTVTATPLPGWSFAYWDGACTGTGECSVTMNGDQTVVAHFTEAQYTLTVSRIGNGTVEVDPEKDTYSYGEQVTLTAIPDPGWVFVGWGGDTSGPLTQIIGTFVSDMHIIANFERMTYTLNYTAGSGGTLSGEITQVVEHGASGTAVTAVPNTGYHFVNWSDGLTANPRTDTDVTRNVDVTANFALNTYTLAYAAGAGGTLSGEISQVVEHGASGTAVTAVPNTGYRFVDWSDGSTANPRTDANVTGHVNVTAIFAQEEYTLTVNIVGSGTVTRAPAQNVYHHGDEVTLVPSADTGWHFAGWTGACVGMDPCNVLMNGNKVVTATFTVLPPVTYQLTIGVAPAGGGMTTPAAGTYTFAEGTVVDVTATPAAGYMFTGWSGACENSGACDVTMDANKAVTATFTQEEYTLTVNIVGSGTVTRTPVQSVYHYGDPVTLVPVPASGWRFSAWSGECTGTDACTVTLNASKAVTATFTQNLIDTYALTVAVDPVAGGTVDPVAGVHDYAAGTVITITATPAGGYAFDRWTGACTGTGTCTVTMDEDKTVTAHFVLVEPQYRIYLPFVMSNHSN